MGSIKYQVLDAINDAFAGGGHDKHSAKANDGTGKEVFSKGERATLRDTGIQLVQFCKTEFRVKQVSQITPNMVSSFLESKVYECKQRTLNNYVARLFKIGELVNNKFRTADVNWRVEAPVSLLGQDKARDIPMDRADYTAVLQYAKDINSTSKAPVAIELAGRFAMRVSETCKLQPRDINFQEMKLHIHESKGGLSRDINIRPNDVEFLKSIIAEKNETQKIVDIREDSVNKWLSRTFEKLEITKYADAKTGVHSIRKMAATEKFYDNIKGGMTEKEAERDVSTYLGHGEDRADVIRNYIYK